MHDALVQAARGAGFALAGGVDIDRVPLAESVTRYDHWLSAGYAGAMEYLKRGRDRRSDPRLVFPEAKSVFCVAWSYSAKPAGNLDPLKGPRYARYLRSTDYHKDITERMERMLETAASRSRMPLKWKVCVDTSAVLERSWASWAGLGWIGKNGMFIHPQLGSYLFLAEALLSVEVGQGPRPLPSYCGNCTRCLKACPTRAIVAPALIDSNLCISYLTLEKRGELAITEDIRRQIGPWIAGCDLCQEVCPFNTKAARAPFEQQDQAISLADWAGLLQETEEQYKARVKNSSLSRVKPPQFSRNLAIALTNSILESSDPELFNPLLDLILARLKMETNPDARTQWERCAQLISSREQRS